MQLPVPGKQILLMNLIKWFPYYVVKSISDRRLLNLS